MDKQAELQSEVEAIVAYADGASRDDDVLFDRLEALVRRDPGTALETGVALARSADPRRREIGVRLAGMAGVVDPTLRDRALVPLRRALDADTDPRPLSAAIVGLGNLNDDESQPGILARAHHSDPVVRDAVAGALPMVGLDKPALAALRTLALDEDDDVRSWATFGLAASDADDGATRDALMARVEDPDYETRVEAIVGLAGRQDERVRPHLLRELADPEHAEALDWAVKFLNARTGPDGFGPPSAE